MKNIYITILFSFLFITVIAQHTNNRKDFNNIVKEVENQYKDKDKGKGTGYKQFKRWEQFVENRLDENGHRLNTCAMAFAAYENIKKVQQSNNSRTHGYWTELGIDTWTNTSGWNPGNGRINEIAFHPSDPNIFYAGASGGGLWKTQDGGSSWIVITDGMPNLAISGIAVSHTNPNTIYILTGDGDSDDLASIGVLKTTDGGSSWAQTGLTFGRDDLIYGTELKMNSLNSEILIATTSNGIYRTDDGGDIWQHVQNGLFYDIEFCPSNPDTVYASMGDSIFTSSNGGSVWNFNINLPNLDNKPRIELAVTPANTSKVYAVLGEKDGYRGLLVSGNHANNWVLHTDYPNILAYDTSGLLTSTQAHYDLAIEVSQTDEDNIFVGGINIWESTDGGDNWEISTHWRENWHRHEYVHADIHELIFNGNVLYTGCDGGIFKTADGGNTWTDLSQGLGIMQAHKIGITNSNTNLVYLGTQDNGTNKYSGSTTVDHVLGGDGFESIIQPTNSDTVYSSLQDGEVRMSTDGGNSFATIIPGDNVTKLFNNPLIYKYYFSDRLITSAVGYVHVIRIAGGSFTKSLPINSHITNLDLSQSNDNLLIASTYGYESNNTSDSLWMTEVLFDPYDDVWTNITGNLPVSQYTISDIAIDPISSNHMIVTFGGYIDGDKVFETWNYGGVWQNVSNNMENVPVNCVAFDPDDNTSVYVGTDLGVFYKKLDSDWEYFSNGLPPVIVNELEINTNENYIYAGTYGRGLWRSSLYSGCITSYNLTSANDPSNPSYTGIQHYEASGYINSTREIQGGYGSDVHYQAGDYIDLKPGFRAYEGNVFRSVIGACGEVVNSSLNDSIKTTKVDRDLSE